MSINKVIVAGNVTQKPVVRWTASGTAVMSIALAVDDRRKNPQTGEWEEHPNYVDCVVFGNRAAALERYVDAGSRVVVEGRLRWSEWESDGQRRSKLEVAVDELEIVRPAS